MAVILARKLRSFAIFRDAPTKRFIPINCKMQPSCNSNPSRRDMLVFSTSFLCVNCVSTPLPVRAEDESNDKDGVVDVIKSLFDLNEKTKSGKILPKAYLKSAREVVKTLRESLKEDPTDVTKFRRVADAAKESIKEYLGNWRGREKVVREESYIELEKAIRSLASFYSKAGPSAALPEEVKSEILKDLSAAEEFL